MSKKHTLPTLAVCLIGVGAAVIVLPKLPGNTVLFVLMILLCPLSHLLMMRSMGHDGHDHGGEHLRSEDCHHSNHEQRGVLEEQAHIGRNRSA